MAQYKTCDLCGAHLDFGESCDCGKEKENAPMQQGTPSKSNTFSLPQKHKIVKRGKKI